MSESPPPDHPDPRITGRYLRRISTQTGAVTLVGVAHDHPASIHRVRTAIQGCDPDTVALELPPLALTRFEQYAARDDPAGGEMSAAIRATSSATLVGIDRPTLGYCRRLLDRLVRVRPDRQTVRETLGQVRSPLSHALRCRVSAALPEGISVEPASATPTDHDTDASDDPATQAADERRQVRRSRAILDSLGSQHRRRGSRLEREAREAEMADRLTGLDGTTVAVVGISHLDPLAERLREGAPRGR